jgi:hypothetical protein
MVGSAGSWTKRVASGKGALFVSLLGFRSSPQVVEAVIRRFFEHPQDRPRVGTDEGLRLLSQSA